MCKGTRGQSVVLNQTGQGRTCCLAIAENVIIYSAKQDIRQASERKDMKGQKRRGKDREDTWDKAREAKWRRRKMRRDKKEETSEEMCDRPLWPDWKQTWALPADSIRHHAARTHAPPCRCRSKKSLHPTELSSTEVWSHQKISEWRGTRPE